MKMRIRALVALVLIPLACVVALAGCSSADDPAEKDALLEQAAMSDMAEIKQIVQGQDYDGLFDDDVVEEFATLGLDPTELIDKVLSVFEYDYTAYEWDDDGNGDVTMAVTSIDLTSVLDAWQQECAEWMTSSEGVALITSDQKAAYEQLGQMLMDDLSASDVPTKTIEVDLRYTWNDGAWELDMSQEALVDTITASLGLYAGL